MRKQFAILPLLALLSCGEPDTSFEAEIPPAALGCDLAGLDSLQLTQEGITRLELDPCATSLYLHSQSGDPAPDLHLRSWARGRPYVEGTVGSHEDGSLYWKIYTRLPLLDSFFARAPQGQTFEEWLLGLSKWPEDFPSPLYDSLLQSLLGRSHWEIPSLPPGFPWSGPSLDSQMARLAAYSGKTRALYLSHPRRALSHRYTDSLAYARPKATQEAWIPLYACDSTLQIRRAPLSAADCGYPEGLTHAQAQDCALRAGGRLPTYAQWRCALFAGDSLPWPLPSPLPDGEAINGAQGLLSKASSWLEDPTDSAGTRRLLIPGREKPLWQASESPASVLALIPQKEAQVLVVRATN